MLKYDDNELLSKYSCSVSVQRPQRNQTGKTVKTVEESLFLPTRPTAEVTDVLLFCNDI